MKTTVSGRSRPWLRFAILALLVVGGLVALRISGLHQHLTMENLQNLSQTVRELGWVAPLVYVLMAIALLVNNMPKERRYPEFWF